MDENIETQGNSMDNSPSRGIPKRVDGWADDSPTKGKGKRKKKATTELDDERLQQQDTNADSSELMVVPELEDLQDEVLTTQIAAPPSIAVTRVATYKELDSELQKQARLFRLDGNIDLKLLANVLSSEADLKEDDKPWEWGRLFTEVSTDIQQAWNKGVGCVMKSPSSMSLPTPRML